MCDLPTKSDVANLERVGWNFRPVKDSSIHSMTLASEAARAATEEAAMADGEGSPSPMLRAAVMWACSRIVTDRIAS